MSSTAPNSLRALPLHQPHIYPPGAPHAVSSSLPTWQDVRNIALADRTVLDSIDYSYPRFFLCLPVRSLAKRVIRRLGSVDLPDCYIFPSSDDVDDYVAQLRHKNMAAEHVRFRSPAPAPEPEPANSENTTMYLAFSALLVDRNSRAHVMDIWVNEGTGITTRHAEYCLNHFDELVSTSPLPQFNTPAARVPTHDPYSAEWIYRGASDLAGLQHYIARLATSEDPVEKPVMPEDVFIFPNGMNAIYNASEALAINNPNTCVVSFGWIYPETITNLRRGQWKEVIPFRLGREEDLDQLEQMLNRNEKPIYAVFCELPSNIKLTSPNLKRIRDLAREYDLVAVCDETVGNFVNVDILPYVDIITTSLTKMFSGAANVTGGRANKNTMKLLMNILTTHHLIARVNYPYYDPDFDNYDGVRRRNGGYGNVFSLVFRNRGTAEHFYDHLDVCKGPSFGTNFTIAIPFVQLSAYNEQEKLEKYGLPKHTVRISVGLEDYKLIRAKLKEALKEVEKFE
ncbi:hypothetical protein LB503_004426, partial [Fusarium chuoi]